MPYKDPEAKRAQARRAWHRTKTPEKLALHAQRAAQRRAARTPEEHAAAKSAARIRNRYTWPQRMYGLSADKLTNILQQQNGCCAICRRRNIKLCIDHDRTTGLVRGLLCDFCNTKIMPAVDRPDLLRRALEYANGVL